MKQRKRVGRDRYDIYLDRRDDRLIAEGVLPDAKVRGVNSDERHQPMHGFIG